MRQALIGGLLLMEGATDTGKSAAAPPPPPPAFIDELAKQLVSTPTAANFDSYAAAFAGDLAVCENGKLAAGGRDAWLAAERQRVGKVDRLVLTYAEGNNAVLIVDRIDDRSGLPSAPTLVFDPRYATRAIRYAVGPDHLVHVIDIVQADGPPRSP